MKSRRRLFDRISLKYDVSNKENCLYQFLRKYFREKEIKIDKLMWYFQFIDLAKKITIIVLSILHKPEQNFLPKPGF